MTKRISIIAAGLVVVVIIILIVLLTTQDIFNLTGTEEENDRQMISTALIQRKDLRTFEKIDGVLEYGSEIQVLPSNNGVLTYIIAEGEDIFRGTLLFKYYKSVTETEMLTAENQIAAADSAVAQAEAALEALTSGATDAQIASADSAVAQAEATLVTSNSSVDTQWVTFRIARQSYCDLSGKLGSSVWTAQVYKAVCPDSENAMTVTAAGLLLNSIFDEPQLVTVGNELLIAYENYKKGLETQISSSKALESAKAQRLALDEAATVADLNNANKALESAKASLRLAEHNSDELIGMMMATVAMYGEHPAWRSFETGMSAGDDIYQLEQNLVSLGYDKDKSILIDREFDENTHKAVEAMQSLMGVSVTGKLSFKDILFIPGPSVVQYSSSHTELGAMIVTTNPVLGLIPIEKVIEKSGEPEVTKSLQKVNSSIEVANQDLVGVGLSVSIELPDENIIAGTISDIGEIAVIPLGNQGEPYLEIVIAIDEVESFPEWTGATVTVSVTKKLASDVLAAPVTSLLAVLGGGYAIEIIENGLTKLVPVSVGLYADGYVEIDGDGIKEGTEVIVP
ncbi:MAG: peptidoglycan-binding protein [SAR202 cluster bacterium]|nr:peptidoglycan-binding protein [SAR202 cluster bacterium]